VTIRHAREADFVRCVEIAHKAWPSFRERESIYHLFCKFFSNTSLICEVDHSTVAFLLGFLSQVDPIEAYIHLVAVDPAFQRMRIAQRLYAHFFKVVREHGVRVVRLIVNPDNDVSLRFHRKLGFRPDLHHPTIEIDGVTAAKDYNGEGIHMVPFRLELDEYDEAGGAR